MTIRAADLDARDLLAGFAAEFAKPPGQIYLDGNSLGLLCKPAEAGMHTITPVEDARRGGQVTLAHPQAGRLSRALRARGVILDFCPPDLLRLCPAPLYTSFAECARAVDILEEILRTGAHNQLPDHDVRVT
jgi:kynureninase